VSVAVISSPSAALPDAQAVMSQAGGENFPVASRLLPRRQRRHLLAIYGFARTVDDVGDEAPGDRLALLDVVERELDAVYHGRPATPLMTSLAETVRSCAIPREPLQAMIQANRQDQHRHSYGSFAELEAYCALSANPIGQLVLHVFAAATAERLALSDRVCTALQLTEHWQDIVEDAGRGRVYLPAEDLERFGCAPADLVLSPAPERVRALVRFQVDRARSILESGAPLIGTLPGRPRLAVAGFVAGGRSALRAIERSRYDVSGGPPRASRAARLASLLGAVVKAAGR
jgi:squalene synthase HpnC